MTKYKFEYIWLDGYIPESNLRSKTKVIDFDFFDEDIDLLPEWAFDGSSTAQAEGQSSDCLLKPVSVYKDAGRKNGYLVMCEVLNADGSPHISNYRHSLPDDNQYWFGFEQEYTFVTQGRPMGFPENGYPAPQGRYYCAVGNGNIAGREIVEKHLDLCVEAGIEITGINAEVMLGQWEYQVFGKGAKRASDDLWISRYLLFRIAEVYGVNIEFAPKPVKGDWNGSGMHTNFSNKIMRETGGEKLFATILDHLGSVHNEHIAVYGSQNHERLTGLHETQSIDKYSYGVSDRGASIRIPVSTVNNNWKGYAEDRRPASNADPYKITDVLITNIENALAKKVEVA